MHYNKTVWRIGDIVTAERLNNIENGISNIYGNDFSNRILDNTEIARLSNGQLYKIDITEQTHFVRYVQDGGNIVEEDDNELGTDYIKCPKYLCFNFNDTNARLMVYFFRQNSSGMFYPVWDVLNFTTSTGIYNYFGFLTCCNRVVEIPDGTYMKIRQAINGDVSLYGWTGVHFGVEQSATSYSPNPTTLNENHYNTDLTTLTIPASAKAIVMKNWELVKLYGFPHGSSTKQLVPLVGRDNPYGQCFTLPEGYDWFRVLLGYTGTWNSDIGTYPTYTPMTRAIDLNNDVSILYQNDIVKPVGLADNIISKAKSITNIEWKNLVKTEIPNGGAYFAKNVIYNGVPYSSKWTDVHFFGWHISKHTLINAMNDSQSKFYTEHDRKGQSYGYGLVCSSFATLCAGWKYPVVTYGFLNDPQVEHYISNQPQIGAITYNGTGHTLIPECIANGEDCKYYTLYECATPVTQRRMLYDFQTGDPHTRHFSYLWDYKYICNNPSADYNYTPYDIEKGTITNGSARPYVGDRGVCTSLTGVKVNIKDTSATTLYVQRYTYDTTTDTFTATGSPTTISISGRTQISVPTSGLVDGGFYGFYTNTDSTVEYIEYHNVTSKSYTEGGNTITPPSGSFWYMLWWETESESGETEIIPRLTSSSKYTYADYRKVYKPNYKDGYIFFKGTLGAYCAPLICSNPN